MTIYWTEDLRLYSLQRRFQSPPGSTLFWNRFSLCKVGASLALTYGAWLHPYVAQGTLCCPDDRCLSRLMMIGLRIPSLSGTQGIGPVRQQPSFYSIKPQNHSRFGFLFKMRLHFCIFLLKHMTSFPGGKYSNSRIRDARYHPPGDSLASIQCCSNFDILPSNFLRRGPPSGMYCSPGVTIQPNCNQNHWDVINCPSTYAGGNLCINNSDAVFKY